MKRLNILTSVVFCSLLMMSSVAFADGRHYHHSHGYQHHPHYSYHQSHRSVGSTKKRHSNHNASHQKGHIKKHLKKHHSSGYSTYHHQPKHHSYGYNRPRHSYYKNHHAQRLNNIYLAQQIYRSAKRHHYQNPGLNVYLRF